MLPEIEPNEYAAALDSIAEEVLESAGVSEPPVDAFEVAAALGIVVARDDCQQGRARYVRLALAGVGLSPGSADRDAGSLRIEPPSQASIWLRDEPRCERRHWAVAHELGEHAAQHVFRRLAVDPRVVRPGTREQVANHLAHRILLPRRWLESDGSQLEWELFALKQRYSTASHELLARRMLEVGPAAIITVCDQGRISYRRGPLGRRAPPMGSEERSVWQRTHQQGCFVERQFGLTRIRGWPIHEPHWQREILRAELVDDLPDE